MNRENSSERRSVTDRRVSGIRPLALAAWLVCLGGGAAGAETLSWFESWSLKGEIGTEVRVFENDHDPETEDHALALTGQLELDRRQGAFRQRARLFARTDLVDSERDLVIVEEAWVEYRQPRFQLRLGVELFNWSATEAFHPADVLNSRNLDSDPENFEKIGEPIAGLYLPVPHGELSLFYLPMRIEPELPSSRSRLNPAPSGWRFEEPIWGDWDGSADRGDFAEQWGVRWLQSRGPVDFDFHYLRHNDRRQPVFIPSAERKTLQPVYLPVEQIGGTLQAVVARSLLKLEWAHRDFTALESALVPSGSIDQPDHWQVAWGFEYGYSYVGGGTSTWILEGQLISGVSEVERANLDLFQKDLLVGYRHDFNDMMGRRLDASLIFDLERGGETLFSLTFAQRFSDTWSARVGMRLIDAPAGTGVPIGLQRLDGDNELRLGVVRGF